MAGYPRDVRAWLGGRPIMRVLVVSEHAKVRRRLGCLIGLESGTTSVVEAGPQTAVVTAREEHPDAAVVDVGLSALSGIRLCEELRALPQPPQVVLITSTSDEWLRRHALDAGALGVLLKDLDTSGLLELVSAAGTR